MPSKRILFGACAGLVIVGAGFAAWSALSVREEEVAQVRTHATPEQLTEHCEDNIGEPRTLQITEGVWVAVGHDLANTIVVQTPEGNVVIDVGSEPERAAKTRAALLEKAPGKTRAIIYTHSHIDHVGGASAWFEEGTEIWATDAFRDHFLKQYGAFAQAEKERGFRQFGRHVGHESLPCSAIGRRLDLDAAPRTGMRMPTHSFSDFKALEFGGVRVELHEAHGETHDQLFVYLPEAGALMPGDNFYATFPNLYTIRGTSPRPVDAWIDSIDRMRRLNPQHLIPSHTIPISGADEIATRLTTYRDGIQWVRDRVVAAANAGSSLDATAESIGLPPTLAKEGDLRELYGQLDWSARAIYTNRLGWFDGRPEALYPPSPSERLGRTLKLMGGAERVLGEAKTAVAEKNYRWAVHLLAMLRDGPQLSDDTRAAAKTELVTALQGLASEVTNTNGRGYLLESAHELVNGKTPGTPPAPDPELLAAIPLSHVFEIMATRLVPERAVDVHESVEFNFTDGSQFHVTIRNQIAEITEGEALPGTPEPIAVVSTSPETWRALALQSIKPLEAVTSGDMKVDGERLAFVRFSKRFDRGIK
jgi:alkyl sulfatase BDS1-like metallo-beta-lactamase superfamily hydrolase